MVGFHSFFFIGYQTFRTTLKDSKSMKREGELKIEREKGEKRGRREGREGRKEGREGRKEERLPLPPPLSTGGRGGGV